MIAYINGLLTYKDRTIAIIDLHGLGYEVRISLQTFDKLPELNQEVKLLTYLQIKEDAHTLVGFHNMEEKDLFLNLISVSGIGLSTAIIMLSSFSANEIKTAIVSENIGLIQSIKGIGAKTAQRVVLELKDKLKKEHYFDTITSNSNDFNAKSEALSALVTLGIPRAAAEKSIEQILKSNPSASVEDLIKLALR
jgi:Holliday junction DNA helicase RuvA